MCIGHIMLEHHNILGTAVRPHCGQSVDQSANASLDNRLIVRVCDDSDKIIIFISINNEQVPNDRELLTGILFTDR